MTTTTTTLKPIPDHVIPSKPIRGIKPEIWGIYGAGVSEDDKYLHYSHVTDGIITHTKSRTKDKRFFISTHSDVPLELYGKHTKQHNHAVIITEGYEDALSARQMSPWAVCVSVPHGAQSAKEYIAKELKWLEEFKTVYIAFDNDIPGRAAVESIRSILPTHTTRIVSIPEQYKDANGMLQAGATDEWSACLRQAKELFTNPVASRQDVLQDAMAYLLDARQCVGISTGYDGLDKVIGGYRGGELLTFIADSGVGKSTLMRNLAQSVSLAGTKVLYVSLEDTQNQVVASLYQMYSGLDVRKNRELIDIETMAIDMAAATENIEFLAHPDLTSIEAFIKQIDIAVRTNDIQVVVLDHLTALVEALPGSYSDVSSRAMNQLRTLCHERNVTTLVVSHINRDKSRASDATLTMADAKHSSSIAQVSDCVLGVSRTSSGRVSLYCIKASRQWNVRGSVQLRFDSDSTVYEEVSDNGEDKENRSTWDRDFSGPHQDTQEWSGGESIPEQPITESIAVRDSPLQVHERDELHTRHTSRTVVSRTHEVQVPIPGVEGIPQNRGQDQVDSIQSSIPSSGVSDRLRQMLF
jgi:twinkle protein